MVNPLAAPGKVHAPFFIFIEGGDSLPDGEILAGLGLTGRNREPAGQWWGVRKAFTFDDRRITTIGDGPGWKVVADDWWYTLWHRLPVRRYLFELSHRHRVFTCAVGDSDHGHDFRLLRDGALVREYVVEYPYPNPTNHASATIVADHGAPLAGETPWNRTEYLMQWLLDLAAHQGFRIEDAFDTMRFWLSAPIDGQQISADFQAARERGEQGPDTFESWA